MTETRVDHKQPTSPRTAGFTLIELLITLVCIALLTSLAWPSYQHLTLSSHRAQARALLLKVAHWLERAASANGSYPATNEVPSNVLQMDGQRYKISVISTPQTFSLSATPIGNQSADVCGTLTLNHQGLRGVQAASQTAAQCWSQ